MNLILRPLLLLTATAALAACTVEPAPVVVERAQPTIVERPVDRPVYIDRPVYVDRPLYFGRTVVVERPFPTPVVPVYTTPRREWVQGYYDAYGVWRPGFWRTM